MLFLSTSVHAGDKCDFSLGADFVSSYIWRGSILAGTSIQPTMGFGIGGFSIGAWGSVDIADNGFKEVDLTASYSMGNFTIGLFDYWVGGEGAYNYFDYSDSAAHSLDVNLLYTFDAFPLMLGWSTIVAGNDMYVKNNGELKRAFSTYVEASYVFRVKEITLETAVGASLWNSSTLYTGYEKDGRWHGTDGFAVVNTALKASKDIKITDRYSLTLFGQLIFNPAKEDIFFVFGIGF